RYLGTVVRVVDFGAFISLTPGKDGLLHVTQLRKLNGGKRVDNVEDVATVGQKIEVEIREIDARGKISLAVIEEDEAGPGEPAASQPTAAERARRRPRAAPAQDGEAAARRPPRPAAAGLPADRRLTAPR